MSIRRALLLLGLVNTLLAVYQ